MWHSRNRSTSSGRRNQQPEPDTMVNEFKVEAEPGTISPPLRESKEQFLTTPLDLGEEAYDEDEGVGAYFAYGFGLLIDEKIDYTIDGITYAIDGISNALGAAASALSCGYTAETDEVNTS